MSYALITGGQEINNRLFLGSGNFSSNKLFPEVVRDTNQFLRISTISRRP